MKDSATAVGLTYDLRSAYQAQGYSDDETAEFDRGDTIECIADALQSLGYAVDRIGHVKQLAARLVAGDRWDIVFNICEGMHGKAREAQVPALLDAYEIPYVFSETLACAVTLHKGMTKDIVRAAGITTADFILVDSIADLKNFDLPYPVFAKPVAEGTGKGVSARSKIMNSEELLAVCSELLKRHQQAVLVECFLPGREFTVGIVGTGDQATALATLEIQLLETADAEIYSYRNKEQCEELVNYLLLAAGELRSRIETMALQAWRVLGCRDAGRIDVRLDAAGEVHFLEINPLAGLHPEHSDLPIMARLVGMEYVTLLNAIMTSAVRRQSSLAA